MTTCAACHYWREIQPGFGFCRKRAPALAPDSMIARWPVTPAEDLCGDWLQRAQLTGKGLALVKTDTETAGTTD